jgi:hypothetical protein
VAVANLSEEPVSGSLDQRISEARIYRDFFEVAVDALVAMLLDESDLAGIQYHDRLAAIRRGVASLGSDALSFFDDDRISIQDQALRRMNSL